MAITQLTDEIHDNLYDALRSIESYDLAEQPGAAEKLDDTAERVSSLSSDLNALCNCEHAAQSDLFSVEGGAA